MTGSPRPATPPSMVERMTLILGAFDGATPRLTLQEIADRSGLPRSTAHRILDQLVKLRSLELGGLAVAHNELREATAPLLHDLHLRTATTVHLAVLDRLDIVYIDKVAGRHGAAVAT